MQFGCYLSSLKEIQVVILCAFANKRHRTLFSASFSALDQQLYEKPCQFYLPPYPLHEKRSVNPPA